jgi:phage shock protein PspC (stress-responsive transcriptional regulator)
MHRPIGGVEGKDPSLRGKVEAKSLRGRIAEITAALLRKSIDSQKPSGRNFLTRKLTDIIELGLELPKGGFLIEKLGIFTDSWLGKITGFERLYVKKILRKLGLDIELEETKIYDIKKQAWTTETGIRIVFDGINQELLKELITQSQGDFLKFIDIVGEIFIQRGIRPGRILIKGPGTIIRGNCVAGVIEGDANCFEWSVAMVILAKVFFGSANFRTEFEKDTTKGYSLNSDIWDQFGKLDGELDGSIMAIQILPYEVESILRKQEDPHPNYPNEEAVNLWHHHYGLLITTSDSERYIVMYPYHIARLDEILKPIESAKSRDEAIDNIIDALSRDDDPNKNQNQRLKRVIAQHLYFMALKVKKYFI